MIVCSCNYISQKDIEEVVHDFLDIDCWQLITVGKVYGALQKRGKCCGCFPNVIDVIVKAIENWHQHQQSPAVDVIPFVRTVVQEHQRCETARALIQMQRKKVS